MIKTLLLFVFVSYSLAAPKGDKVDSLPGMNDGKPFPFNVYSGYLQANMRNLHYMFIES